MAQAACARHVDTRLSGAALGAHRAGDEALAVVDVRDMHLLVVADVGSAQQSLFSGAPAFVVEFAIGHDGRLNLGFMQGAKHVGEIF